MEFLIPFDITRLKNQCRADRVRGSQKLGNKRVSSNFMRYRSGRELRLRAVGTPPEYVRERESHCVALSFGFLGERGGWGVTSEAPISFDHTTQTSDLAARQNRQYCNSRSTMLVIFFPSRYRRILLKTISSVRGV
jgi:hypothetical protein